MYDDLKTASRSLRSAPTFTAVAIFVLALGIGATTAIFSVASAIPARRAARVDPMVALRAE